MEETTTAGTERMDAARTTAGMEKAAAARITGGTGKTDAAPMGSMLRTPAAGIMSKTGIRISAGRMKI